jgi:hypothetical protein
MSIVPNPWVPPASADGALRAFNFARDIRNAFLAHCGRNDERPKVRSILPATAIRKIKRRMLLAGSATK